MSIDYSCGLFYESLATSDFEGGLPRFSLERGLPRGHSGCTKGRLQNLRLPGTLPIEGGIPLIEDGRIVGAIAVSGARPEQDGVCVKAAIDVLA
jgi:hypothetical protein